MKKHLFTLCCLICLASTGLFAQKGKAAASESAPAGTSSAREAKNLGKGSPILQRQAGQGTPAGDDKSKEMTSPAPAAAPTGGQGNGGATIQFAPADPANTPQEAAPKAEPASTPVPTPAAKKVDKKNVAPSETGSLAPQI